MDGEDSYALRQRLEAELAGKISDAEWERLQAQIPAWVDSGITSDRQLPDLARRLARFVQRTAEDQPPEAKELWSRLDPFYADLTPTERAYALRMGELMLLDKATHARMIRLSEFSATVAAIEGQVTWADDGYQVLELKVAPWISPGTVRRAYARLQRRARGAPRNRLLSDESLNLVANGLAGLLRGQGGRLGDGLTSRTSPPDRAFERAVRVLRRAWPQRPADDRQGDV